MIFPTLFNSAQSRFECKTETNLAVHASVNANVVLDGG